MEWFILLVLVPAILVPIVLLFGFAGCTFSAPIPPSPLAPVVTATPKSADNITVSWENTDSSPALKYRFVRTGGTLPPRDEETDASITSAEDTGLEAATDYTYEVTTFTQGGTSPPGPATARTFFKTAFAIDPATVPTDQTVTPGNFCFVQRIPAGQLLAGGSRVAIKVWGTPGGNATINNIYISRAAGTGNPWDSAGDLTPVRTSPLTLPDATPQELAPINYNLDQTQDLILAFDFTAIAGAANIRYVAAPGVALFFKQGVQQASLPTRDPNYLTQADPRLYFVVTIGVA